MLYTPYLLPLLLSAAVTSALGVYAWRRGSVPAARPFAALMAIASVWALGDALTIAAVTLEAKRLALDLYYPIVAFFPLPMLAVITRQIGHPGWLTGRRIALLAVIPSITMLLSWTEPWHQLMRFNYRLVDNGWFNGIAYDTGPWGMIDQLWGYVIFSVVLGLLVFSGRVTSLQRRRQQVLILAGTLLPFCVDLLWNLGITPLPGFDAASSTLFVTGILIGMAIFRYQFLYIVPLARGLVLERMQDGILVMDALGRLVDFNPAAERMLGLHRGDLRRPLETSLAGWPELIAVCRGAPGAHGEIGTGNDGGPILEVTASMVDDQAGAQSGCIALLRDISQRKRTEQALRDSQRIESIGVLAGGVAHNFNNLLTGVLLQAELANYKLEAAHPARPHLQKVMRSAQQGADLTRQLLAFSGQGNYLPVAINLNQLIQQSADLLATLLPSGVALQLELGEDLPAFRADLGQARQYAVNLIMNAGEASEGKPGQVTLSTARRRAPEEQNVDGFVPGLAARPGEHVCLSVSDTGAGMDAATLSRIFEPFFSTKFTGRGLGLSAVYGILSALKGGLQVHSQPGAGSTFTVWFPVGGETK